MSLNEDRQFTRKIETNPKTLQAALLLTVFGIDTPEPEASLRSSSRKTFQAATASRFSLLLSDGSNVRIESSGLKLIEEYFISIQAHIDNYVMLARLQAIEQQSANSTDSTDEDLQQTEQDSNFYRHNIQKIFSYQEAGWEIDKIKKIEQAKEISFRQPAALSEYRRKKYEYLMNHPMYHRDVLTLYSQDLFRKELFSYCAFPLQKKIDKFHEKIIEPTSETASEH